MPLRVLVVGEAEKKAAKEVVAFAMRPENLYRPWEMPSPGDNPNHTLRLWDFRCVFTITASQKGEMYKHLSISTPAAGPGKLPHTAAVEEIAHLFSIEGTVEEWAKDGHVYPHARENCVVVISEYKP
jgi:hypothetical protein